jgi:hypothetical protein
MNSISFSKWRAIFLLQLSLSVSIFAQSTVQEQNSFCSALMNVLESGRQDNFESIGHSRTKASAFLAVPVAPAKIPRFPVTYVDKDSRFVAKSNVTYDSLSAIQELEVLKEFVGTCLDTAKWEKWNTEIGDDASTLFFIEFHRAEARSAEFLLTLAMVKTGTKTYTINLFLKRSAR